MRKVSNPIAAIVLLTLAASTALRFHSWHAVDTQPSGWEYSSSESRRKLKHVPGIPPPHTSNGLYDQIWRDLKRRGKEPGTKSFDAVLRNQVSKQEYALIDELSRFHQSESAFDRTWRGLVKAGKSPGTPPFERSFEQKGPRREEVRKENKHWGEAALKAKKSLTEAEIKFEEAAKNLKDAEQSILQIVEQSQESHEAERQLEVMEETLETAAEIELQELLKEGDYQPLAICDRNADVGSVEDFAAMQKYAQCSDITKDKPILLLEGTKVHGRTGNNLLEFLHAIQEARDMNISLGVMRQSWAMNVLLKMWMAIDSDDWQAQFEQTFCVKIFKHEKELEGWNVVDRDTKELFWYKSEIPLEDYVASQEYSLRALLRNYNTGDGKDASGVPVQDMCSGINAIFGEDQRSSAMYSVIHSRSLEGEPGYRMLRILSKRSGCDRAAALEMEPDYIKSILEPLGMMEYPIVFITDGQNPVVLERLLSDPDLGPMIRTVPEEACWIGGDLTLAIMSNAFIGNPASTFTGFVAKSRLALGFGHNYLFRARDKDSGEWKTVCGDHCIFDKSIMNVMS